MNAAEIIARVLKEEGVDVLTCYPHNDLIETCAQAGIRIVVARTERVAVNMADGYSRMTGGQRFGVVTAQYGPGSENAYGAIAQAFADSSPILYMPGTYPSGWLGVSPNFEATPALARVCKLSMLPRNSGQVIPSLRRAFAALRNGKPGPVSIELAEDLIAAEIPNGSVVMPTRSTPLPDPGEVERLYAAISTASLPVIFAGQGIFYSQATAELRELAELLRIPVMTTLNGKSAFPEDHPLALGTAGRSAPATVTHYLEHSDLIIGIGTSFTRSEYITAIPDGKRLAQVTNSEIDLGKDYEVELGVLGDARAALRQLAGLAKVDGRTADGFTDSDNVGQVSELRRAFLDAWLPKLTSDAKPVNPYRVIWELMHIVDRTRTIVSHDAGSPRDQTTPVYEAIVPRGYMGWGKSTQLGTSLGLMMGAKLARPDWLCVAIMGEAAFGMVGMDLETAVRCDIPILAIVLHNGMMANYSPLIPVAAEKYNAATVTGDYERVADGLGAYATTVTEPAELRRALEEAIRACESGTPALVQVISAEETIPLAG